MRQREKKRSERFRSEARKYTPLTGSRAALAHIATAAKQQTLMQAMLAYVLLWRWEGEQLQDKSDHEHSLNLQSGAGLGMTTAELDYACEKFLVEHFNYEVDFDVTKTLRHLLSAGVVRCDHLQPGVADQDRRYHALPLVEAHTALYSALIKLI